MSCHIVFSYICGGTGAIALWLVEVDYKDELDPLTEGMGMQYYPKLIGQDYLVMGTVERKTWREGHHKFASIEDIFKALHDFKQHLVLEPARYMWVKDD